LTSGKGVVLFVDEEVEASKWVFCLGAYLPTWHSNFCQYTSSKMVLDVKYRAEDVLDPAD
jgi:hypothetical protein